MAVAHVFAETNIGDHDQLGTLRFDRAHGLLNDAVFRVGAAAPARPFRRNAKEQHRLQAQASWAAALHRLLRSGANWKTPGMLAIARLLAQLFAHEKRQNEIVRASASFRAPDCAARACGAGGAGDEPVFSQPEAKRAASGQRRKLDAGALPCRRVLIDVPAARRSQIRIIC